MLWDGSPESADAVLAWIHAGAPDDEKPLPVVAAAGSDRVALVWNDASAVARLVALSGSEGSPLWSEALPATIANLAGDAAGPVLAGHIVGPIAFASGELSALGPGETAIVAGPGAIANAIRAATGYRPLRFPIRTTDLAASRATKAHPPGSAYTPGEGRNWE